MEDKGISINKFISSKGLCSRREADVWIEQGTIMINDKVAKKGNRVYPGDTVVVNGQKIKNKSTGHKRHIYLILNKPRGVTCTTDKNDKTNIIDYLNFRERIFPVGRLDKDSTGLILLTNNGDIVNEILRKENKNEKEYIVTVNKEITQDFITKMSKPMVIMGTKTLPVKINQLGTFTFRIVLTQGLNRQIRRMCEKCGYRVKALKRNRIMHLKLQGMREGEWRVLTQDEVDTLHEMLK